LHVVAKDWWFYRESWETANLAQLSGKKGQGIERNAEGEGTE